MTTLQIALVTAAVAVLVVLIILRLVTRRGKASREADEGAYASGVSFLDDAPQDTLAGLGKIDPVAVVGLSVSEVPETDADWPPSLRAIAGERGAELHGASSAGFAASQAAGKRGWAPAAFQATEPPAASAAEPAGGRLVPLSSIMVTTSTKIVDLDDPEVRRMLADLVDLEIEQAVELRRQGLTVDAVIQLSEAEKIAEALHLEEPTQHVREMIAELRGLQ